MAETPKNYDVVLLHSPTEDGAGVRVLRARPGTIEAGEVRPIREGAPIQGGEVVKLRARDDAPWVCDVDVLHSADASPAPTSARNGGPAQVASRAYRDQWDHIFGPNAHERKQLN